MMGELLTRRSKIGTDSPKRTLHKQRHAMQKDWPVQHQHVICELKNALMLTSQTSLAPQHELKCRPSTARSIYPTTLGKRGLHIEVENSGTATAVMRYKVAGKQKDLELQLGTTRWLPIYHRAWELCGHFISFGWTFSFRTWVEVDYESELREVFHLVEDGDIEALQRLFQDGTTSPFCRLEYGRTLLDVSISDD